jgi:tRNA (guanine-N7-)-methyltransferase
VRVAFYIEEIMSDTTSLTGRLYGRRKGRKLRPRQVDRLDTLLPQITVPQDVTALDPVSLFTPAPSAIWLEIGFGGGEHLAEQAAAHPDVGVIGCEPFLNGIVNLLKQVEERNLANVRVHPGDARLLLDALPDACLSRVFLLFPDPWPKKRHIERRFASHDNLSAIARVLRPDGEFRVASDEAQLILWMEEQVNTHPAFRPAPGTGPTGRVLNRPTDWPQSRYEQKALIAGRDPVLFRFQLK